MVKIARSKNCMIEWFSDKSYLKFRKNLFFIVKNVKRIG